MATFDIQCTLPPPDTTFVRSPNARGTLDIVWSCMAVIILCTWSVLHLNVPPQIKSKPGWQTFVRSIWRAMNKLKWMAINILGPELPFAMAVAGRLSVRRLEKHFDHWKEVDQVQWTSSHTQLANAGGFTIAFSSKARSAPYMGAEELSSNAPCLAREACISSRNERKYKGRPLENTEMEDGCHGVPLLALNAPVRPLPPQVQQLLEQPRAIGWGCPHFLCGSQKFGEAEWQLDAYNTAIVQKAYDTLNLRCLDDKPAITKVLKHPTKWLANLGVLCYDRWYIDANQLLLARRLGIIGRLPDISSDRISDLNKGDAFVKTLAMCQILWLCVQLITRQRQGASSTQLEVVTIGYAVCTAVTYLLLYDRPKDVQTVFEIEADLYPSPKEMTEFANAAPDSFGMQRRSVSLSNNSVPAHASVILGASSIATTLFGSLHFVAWYYKFPTQMETTLWRVSTIVTVVAIPLVGWPSALSLLNKHLLHSDHVDRIARSKGVYRTATVLSCVILLPAFVAARAFTVVEAVRTLAYQPADTYRSTWAANIPHVG